MLRCVREIEERVSWEAPEAPGRPGFVRRRPMSASLRVQVLRHQDLPVVLSFAIVPASIQAERELAQLTPQSRQELVARARDRVTLLGYLADGPLTPDPANPLRFLVGTSTVWEAASALRAADRLLDLASRVLRDEAYRSLVRGLRGFCTAAREQLQRRPPPSHVMLSHELYIMARAFWLVPTEAPLPETVPLLFGEE